VILSATSQFLLEKPPHPCHPERTPDFLLRCSNQRSRMRLSVRKAARGLSTPRSLTGNPEEAEGPAVRPSRTQLRKGLTRTPSPIRSLIWTALNPDPTRMLIGNHSKTKSILFETKAVPYNQRITCTPSPIYSLIWTALAENAPGRQSWVYLDRT
jgi:hypothetical protein